MKKRKDKQNIEIMQLIKTDNDIDYNKEVKVEEKTFEKLMFIYSMAIREFKTKMDIIKEEFKVFYDYDLIDHINTRIKTPQSIFAKMEKKQCDFTYKEMIENINDIAGIRIICQLKRDIFSIRDLIAKLPNIHILKQKDYVTNPKESGYSSYHMILEVPVVLSQDIIYVKVEVQIRTLAMDFWANIEHSMKYKANQEISKKKSKELVNCAKIVGKLDNKMALLNGE